MRLNKKYLEERTIQLLHNLDKVPKENHAAHVKVLLINVIADCYMSQLPEWVNEKSKREIRESICFIFRLENWEE